MSIRDDLLISKSSTTHTWLKRTPPYTNDVQNGISIPVKIVGALLSILQAGEASCHDHFLSSSIFFSLIFNLWASDVILAMN